MHSDEDPAASLAFPVPAVDSAMWGKTSALETFGVSQDSVPRMISGRVLSVRFASSAVFPTAEQQLTVIKHLACLFCLLALVGVEECVGSNPKLVLKLGVEWV